MFVPYLKFGFYKAYFTEYEEEFLEIAGLLKYFLMLFSQILFICTNVQFFR